MVVFANESLAAQAKLLPEAADWDLRIGGLHEALPEADVAIAIRDRHSRMRLVSRADRGALQDLLDHLPLGRLFVVKHIAMPNALAGREVFPNSFSAKPMR